MIIPDERINKTREMMCEDFCKWPTQLSTQEQLDRFCAECPLNNLDYDEFWGRREECQE